MSSDTIAALIGAAAVIMSVLLSAVTTAVVIGVKWGGIKSDVENMKQDLAEIKGMFVLTLKNGAAK